MFPMSPLDFCFRQGKYQKNKSREDLDEVKKTEKNLTPASSLGFEASTRFLLSLAISWKDSSTFISDLALCGLWEIQRKKK